MGKGGNCWNETYSKLIEGIPLVSNFPSILPSPQVSSVLQNIKFGGKVKLQVLDQTSNVLKEFNFIIKGKNPKIGSIMQYIDSSFPSYWMLKYIAMAETDLYKQGYHAASDEAHHFRRFQTATNSSHMESDYHLDWAQSLELPILSFDCGFGTFQLTDPKPSIEEMWDWKKSVEAAKDIIISKKSTVKSKILTELTKVDKWNKDNPKNKVSNSIITYAGHEWAFSVGEIMKNYNPKLTDYFNQSIDIGQHSILDAGLILYFNGNGGSTFLKAKSTNGAKPVWEIFDSGYGGTLYIEKTMTTNIPIY